MSTTDMPTALVVGASRGIGSALAKQLKQDGYDVIATARKPDGLSLGEGIEIIQLDTTDDESVKKAAGQIESLDLLVVMAATGGKDDLLTTSPQQMTEYLDANVVGPHRIVLAFLDALRKGQEKKIILISSQSGSLTKQFLTPRGFMGPYAVTKAALNMMAVQLHNELHKDGFTVNPLHPGWVATDMGNQAGSGGMPVEKSAAGLVQVIKGLDLSKSGHFYDFSGEELPW